MSIPALWRHQEDALRFVEERWNSSRRGVLLALIMGAGKSRVVVELARRRRLSPVLILSPLRVVDVWPNQFAQYASEYRVVPLGSRSGTVADKTQEANNALLWSREHAKPLALVINYESARLAPFSRWAMRRSWPLTIADESHRLKEPSGAISRFVGRLGLVSRYRLGLTGTPMPHSPLDVWAQFRFLDHSLYDPTFTSFRARYAEMDGFFPNQVKQWKDLDDLRQKFFSLAFQVGAEVLDLPESQDLTLECDLGAQAARAYAQMEREMFAWIDTAGAAVTAANALVRLLRLAQITNGIAADSEGREHRIDDAKERLLEELLEDLPADEPVVVFARFKADLAAIHRVAKKLERRSGELSGSIDDLRGWQRGASLDPVILAVQIQAGGEGIDLTRSRYGVYYSIGFKLGDYLQSRSRVLRPGQTRPVAFYHLMVRKTFDQIVTGALARRQDLVDSVLKEFQCHRQPPTPIPA